MPIRRDNKSGVTVVYLEKYTNITIKTYSKDSKAKKLIKDDKVVIVDKLVYDNYLVDVLSDIDIILEDSIHGLTYTINYKNTFGFICAA